MPVDLRDSGGVQELRQKLRQLSAEHAPPIPWPEFKRRQLLRRAETRAAQRRQLARIATVALVMIGALTLRERWPHAPARSQPASGQQVRSVDWDEAAARSVASRRWLALQPAEPAIVRVGTRQAVTNLEDRIAWMDDTLTVLRAQGAELPRARALQYERDRLINSLAQVRYAETLAAQLP